MRDLIKKELGDIKENYESEYPIVESYLKKIRGWYKEGDELLSRMEYLFLQACRYYLGQNERNMEFDILEVVETMQGQVTPTKKIWKDYKNAFLLLLNYFFMDSGFKEAQEEKTLKRLMKKQEEGKKENEENAESSNCVILDPHFIELEQELLTLVGTKKESVFKVAKKVKGFQEKYDCFMPDILCSIEFEEKLNSLELDQLDYIFEKLEQGIPKRELLVIMDHNISVQKMEQILKIVLMKKVEQKKIKEGDEQWAK